MKNNPLHIVFTENITPSKVILNKKSRRDEIREQMDLLWQLNPEKFDPQQDCIEKKRIQSTFDAIASFGDLSKAIVVDIGCGNGTLARMIRDAGGNIDAVDVSPIALSELSKKNIQGINLIQDCLPTTKLLDKAYDIVICTEVIGYLNPSEYRMAMAELARLVKKEGVLVCSTSLDINTENPLDRFAALGETEFNIDEWLLDYHRLLIRLRNFFEKPARYAKAGGDLKFKEAELKKKKGLSRKWFAFNSSRIITPCWKLIAFFTRPIQSYLRTSTRTMSALERLSRFIWSDEGISHATFIGKLRPLSFPVKEDRAPRELNHKRQVWE